jgi:hypothetical protein
MLEEREPSREYSRAADESAPDRRDVMTEQCSQCGDAVPSDEWHPVATERDDDGRVEIHDFCSEGCRSAWQTGVSS